MEVIPAVDLMNGRVVRLLKGNPQFPKSYEHLGSPVEVAMKWEAEGAKSIHVIDLNAALELGSNLHVIKEIVNTVGIPVQVGGGIRSLESARGLLNLGVDRIILGSLAFEEPHTLEILLEEYGSRRIIIALDHLNGTVMVRGWKTPAKLSPEVAASRFSRLGVNLFLVTSVARDGTLMGPDLDTLFKVRHLGVDVIAAGGISSLEDLLDLKKVGVRGVIVGKALYEGRFSLSEALKVVDVDD